jgi:hypothetical protein
MIKDIERTKNLLNSTIVNYDFASLYPSTMTMVFGKKNSLRKRKISKIFNL